MSHCYCYAKFRYVECCQIFIVMLSAVFALCVTFLLYLALALHFYCCAECRHVIQDVTFFVIVSVRMLIVVAPQGIM